MANRDVIVLNEDTPQLEVPQSGDSYRLPRDTTVSGDTVITGTISVGGTTTLSGSASISGSATFSGAMKINRTIVTGATYSISSSDYLLGITRTASGACAITFPSAQIITNRVWLIKDEGGNSATNNITISTSGSEKIDGQDTLIIDVNYRMVTIYSDGTNLFSDKYSFKWEDLK